MKEAYDLSLSHTLPGHPYAFPISNLVYFLKIHSGGFLFCFAFLNA